MFLQIAYHIQNERVSEWVSGSVSKKAKTEKIKKWKISTCAMWRFFLLCIGSSSKHFIERFSSLFSSFSLFLYAAMHSASHSLATLTHKRSLINFPLPNAEKCHFEILVRFILIYFMMEHHFWECFFCRNLIFFKFLVALDWLRKDFLDIFTSHLNQLIV